MSKANYKKFKGWYEYTVENASDEVIVYIMECLAAASEVAMENIEKMEKKEYKKQHRKSQNS